MVPLAVKASDSKCPFDRPAARHLCRVETPAGQKPDREGNQGSPALARSVTRRQSGRELGQRSGRLRGLTEDEVKKVSGCSDASASLAPAPRALAGSLTARPSHETSGSTGVMFYHPEVRGWVSCRRVSRSVWGGQQDLEVVRETAS